MPAQMLNDAAAEKSGSTENGDGEIIRSRHGADTRPFWAPPNENDTRAYIRFASSASGLGADQKLDFHRHEPLKLVLVAMIQIGNGQHPYTAAQIHAGLVRAGRKRDFTQSG